MIYKLKLTGLLLLSFLLSHTVSAQDQEINLVKGLPKEKIEKVNLGNNINREASEYVPVIAPDGKTLYMFVIDEAENYGQGDIWYSKKLASGEWDNRQNIGIPLNNEVSNMAISVSPDNNTLFLGRRYKKKGKNIIDNGRGFSLSHRIKDGWSTPTDLEVTDFKNKSKYGEFCMSAHQNKIIHAIKMDDTHGDQDLYISFKQAEGRWSKPKNLGTDINTKGAENSPFLASDGKTLYFSTNGRPGYGKNDIFVSHRLDDSWTKWSEPENLGPSVNTPEFDAYFTLAASGEYAYLVSSENSHGKADIWKIKLPDVLKPRPVILVYGKVLNSKTKEPIQADITYRLLETNEEVGVASSNPEDGTYKIILPAGMEYSFMASKKGIITVSENIDLKNIKKYDEIERNLYLTPIQVGQTVHLNNLFFVTGKSEISKWSHPELKRLIDVLKENKAIEIEISGHTDNVGSDKINNKISLERAESVKTYLVKAGIKANRLTAKGYGEAKPYVSNKTAEGRKKNRRVDFTILKL